ncbi:unnamed protein product [Protopolystoma xenopodis]|uniref:Uncharacterized protein n=1 Tax=Protopolystoma xenopodis TaxID=117903 RepID=A0A3S5B8P7_9PLAT|nr:unnamed protein product [Protopolystoma xenopodis]
MRRRSRTGLEQGPRTAGFVECVTRVRPDCESKLLPCASLRRQVHFDDMTSGPRLFVVVTQFSRTGQANANKHERVTRDSR